MFKVIYSKLQVPVIKLKNYKPDGFRKFYIQDGLIR